MKRKVFFLAFLLAGSVLITAQSAVTIKKYGCYVFDNGVFKEVPPTKYEVCPFFIWKNYAILSGVIANYGVVYNMTNGAITEWLSPIRYHEWARGYFNPIEKGPGLFFYVRGTEFEFDAETLETINKRDTKEEEKIAVIHPYHQPTTKEWISERTARYRGKNFYLDITYGPDIDLYHFSPGTIGGVENIFITSINEIDDAK